MECPQCGMGDIVKNGKTRHGKQGFKCRSCGRQFGRPAGRVVPEAVRRIIDNLLMEQCGPSWVAQMTEVSRSTVDRRRREIGCA